MDSGDSEETPFPKGKAIFDDDDDEVGNDDGYEVICAQEIDQIPTLAQPAT